MTDLRLDYQLLDEIRASLRSLAADFGSIEVMQDGYNAAMGSPAIASAMNGFAGNWSVHRQKLVASMQALEQMAEGTRSGFTKTDDDLRQQVTFRYK
jgi:hypothetical protein